MSIESLQIKRNKEVYNSKEQAINGLNEVSSKLKDGELVLSRYWNEEGSLETLIGVETVTNDTNHIVYLDSFTDISGKEIKASATTVTQDITVAGGPLAEYIQDTIPTISAGTNIQDLLFSLFCQELYPTITSSNSKQGNVTASINAPTLTVKNGSTVVSTNASLEVGTKLSATTISFNGNSRANASASTVNGMTYGYSTSNNNTQEHTESTITKQPTTGHNTTSIAKLTCTINSGFTSAASYTVSGANITSLSKSNYSLGAITDGTNKITVSVTGQSIQYSISGISSVYPCSNLGNTKSNLKTTAVEQVAKTSTTQPTNSTTFTINGVRYGFHGKVDESTTITSNVIRNLTKITASTITEIKASGTTVIKYIVAIPQTWDKEITYVEDNFNHYGITNSYKLSSTSVLVTDASGGNATAYDIYIYTSAIADDINHTITLGNK